MGDNVAVTPGNGATIGTRDAGSGVEIQRVIPQTWSTPGVAGGTAEDVGPGNALPVATGVSPVQSLLNKSATTDVPGVLDNTVARSNHSLFVVSGIGVSAGVVTLQGSNDNVNWFSTSATCTTSSASTAYAANVGQFPFRYIQAKITTTITGGTITAYVASA